MATVFGHLGRTCATTVRRAPRRIGRVVTITASVLTVAGALLATSSPASASGPTITGSGSSYAAIAITQWVNQVAQRYGDSVNYSTSSSVVGLNEFAQQQVDVAATEIGYSTNQANYTPPPGYAYQYLPTVAGSTCVMFNLADPITGQPLTSLQLDTHLLVGIFTGTISTWGQLAQGGLNPELAGDANPIVTVFRTDPSGENYIFSDYFNTLDPGDWAKFTAALNFPGGPQAIWPFPQSGSPHPGYNFASWNGEQGFDNASQYVASNPGSVTYVETGYAIEHHEPCAAIQNLPGGAFVQPSAYGDAVALLKAQLLPDLEQLLTGVFTDPDPNAYPISAYSYLVAPEGQMNPAKGAVLGRFIQFLACQGQLAAQQLGYSPLPPNLVEDDFQAIQRINGAAAPPPPSMRAPATTPTWRSSAARCPQVPALRGGRGVPLEAPQDPRARARAVSSVGPLRRVATAREQDRVGVAQARHPVDPPQHRVAPIRRTPKGTSFPGPWSGST